MKRILTSFAIVAASLTFAQVSVSGDDNHTPEATLDVKAIGGTNTADGILIPRVDRARAQTMKNVKHSTLIYVDNVGTGAKSGQANQIDATGFYYFDTTVGSGEWVKLGAGSTATPQTWRDIRTASDVTGGKKGGIHKVSSNRETIPATAFLVITDLTGNTSVRLPNPADEGITAGKMIAISKIGTGQLAVLDHEGLSGNIPGSKLLSDGNVSAFTGKIFITDGDYWYALTY